MEYTKPRRNGFHSVSKSTPRKRIEWWQKSVVWAKGEAKQSVAEKKWGITNDFLCVYYLLVLTTAPQFTELSSSATIFNSGISDKT